MLKKAFAYCKASSEELMYKRTWPSGRELGHNAVVVLTASIIIAIAVFALDQCFQFVMENVYPH